MELREGILIAIVLLAAYVGYQLYRVSRAGRAAAPNLVPPEPQAAEPPASDRLEVVADEGVEDEAGDEGRADEGSGDDDGDGAVYERPKPALPAAPAAPDAFQHELEVRQLRRDVEQQRAELTELRAELRRSLDEIRELVRTQKEQADASLATRGASPEYNEALVFARRGLDAETIAERCGITVAEAELVQSLARSQSGEAGSPA